MGVCVPAANKIGEIRKRDSMLSGLLDNEFDKFWSLFLRHAMKTQINIDETTYFNTTLNLFLENQNLLSKCTNDDCIMGCFGLDYKLINCP